MKWLETNTLSLSESFQHKRIKEIVANKLKEWTGATLKEYPSSGHELDVFAVTLSGISIYVEVIWSSSKLNFFRDILMISTSDADVKIAVTNPEIMNKEEFQRQFEKVAIAQRRLNIAMHGSLIDGEKILNDEKYVETDFKNIVFSLVSHVATRGKTAVTQAVLEPPKPNLPAEIGEKLLANLFHITKYPATIFSSPALVEKPREVYQKLGNQIRGIPFRLKNKKLYTFEDLRGSSPFSSVINQSVIAEEKVTNWIQDEEKRNDLVFLFNSGIRSYCESRGLYFDKEHSRFVCLLNDGRTRTFAWRRETKWGDRELAACIKGRDGTILYCRHYAVDLSVMLLDDNLFLKIAPTLVFTYDGYRAIHSEKLALLMSRYLSKQYNSSYIDIVRFWGKFLSKLDANITIPVGKERIEISSSPFEISTKVGIPPEKER